MFGFFADFGVTAWRATGGITVLIMMGYDMLNLHKQRVMAPLPLTMLLCAISGILNAFTVY